MASRIRTAVIGAGAIGKNTHVAGFRAAGAEVVAICDTDAARAGSAAAEYGIKPFTDWRAMLERMPEIEAVSIAVPNCFHRPICIAAMDAGKHVICEKPLAMNLAESEEMVLKAEETGLILALHLQHRFAWRTRWLGAQIEKGRLGEIYHVKASILRVNSIPKGWFQVRKFAGGGAVMDLGPHLLDLAWVLSGRPQPLSVSGYSYSKLGIQGAGFGKWGAGYETGHEMDTEDFGGALIRLDGGKTIELEAAWAVHLDEPTLQCTFFGDRAGAKLFPKAKIYSRDGEPVEEQQPDGEDKSPFSDFIRCIEKGTRPEATGHDGLMVMQMLEALYMSSGTGREISLLEPMG